MKTTNRKRFTRLVGVAASVAALNIGAASFSSRPSAAVAPPRIGIVCTKSSTPDALHPTFNLVTSTGYISLPDGNTTYMYGYNEAGKTFQYPGPVLCVNQGDVVTVHLQNSLNVDSSIVFPGQDGVTSNGVAVQPEFNGTGGTLSSMTNTAAKSGGSVSYTFTASKPGTYIYESGTNAETQVRMGLFGALIIYPTMGADHAYNRIDSQFMPSEEFLILLSEIDPFQHDAVENSVPFDINEYHPRYWLINGRGFPDSVADNYAAWLPSQPYGALARIHPFNNTIASTDPAYHPYPGLGRYLNVGTEDYPFHPHGNNGSIIGRDGNPLAGPAGQGAPDLSFEKFSINIGPGQTWDVLFKWYDAENYGTGAGQNPVPVTVPNVANQVFGMFYSGSPYLGASGTLPPGTSTLNQCGEYYIIAHNHALYQITSWGVNMTGPITYMRVDPPLGPNNKCPA